MSALLSASFFVYKERKRITRLCLSCTEWCLALSQGGKQCLSPYYSRVRLQEPYTARPPSPAAGIKLKESGLRVQGTCVAVDLQDL